MSKLKMAALNVFIHTLDTKDIEPLRQTFQCGDQYKTGFIDIDELKEALDKSNSSRIYIVI
jgi:Ca2+-binding EF-hand superfamily protein